MTFDDLGLSEKVRQAVATVGYSTPTPIQAQAIPVLLERKDVIGIAQTGTGKTASFVLPMLTLLESGRARARMPRTLILEPTRELAAQVEENFIKYGANSKLNVALLIGGVSFDEQLKKLDRGVDVLIATPGRMLDHFERGKLLLTGVEILVIDEADRMLDMGFIPDIERICKLIPPTRQTMMFSATMPPEIKRLADAFLKNPVRVEVAKPATTAKTVKQYFVGAGREDFEKRDTLREHIRTQAELKNAIIFCNRKRDVAVLARSLEKHGFSVGALHGDMDQRARMATLDAFKNNRLTLLVASDVAARGLDIPDVSHVFNYDVPIHADDYVHRIGRTGRAGRSGIAITVVTSADAKHLAAIEKLTGDDVEWLSEKPSAEKRAPRAEGERERGRGKRGERSERGEKRVSERGGERREARPRTERAPERAAEPAEAAAPRAPVERAKPAERAPARADARGGGRREPPRRDRPAATPVGFGRDFAPKSAEPETEAVGLGDHVPAFLLRPVKIAR